jgi:hypothetical protein
VSSQHVGIPLTRLPTDDWLIQIWEEPHNLDHYVNLGRVWYSAFVNRSPSPIRSSSPIEHHFIDGPYPAPTLNDEAWVNRTRPAIDGRRWVFQRTVYQNKHTKFYHRIVHLFAREDELGNVEEVNS